MNKFQNKLCIIFGLGPAGLFLSRNLKRAGANVVAFCKIDDIGRFSNTITKYYITESGSEISTILLKILSSIDYTPIAYICSDQYLTTIIEDQPDILKLLNFAEPNEKLLRLIANKEALIEQCRTSNINIPLTFNLQDLNESVFPIIVKPNIKRGHSPIKKVTYINSTTELSSFLDNAKAHNLSESDLIFQQAIRGNNKYEYGYGGYFKNGQPIKEIFFRQVRQLPQGVSCYTIEIQEEDIKKKILSQTLPFIRNVCYSGFLQFDLKEDEITKKIYVLDINPRPWGSVSILSKYCKTATVFEKEERHTTKIVKWRFPLKEIFSFKNKNNLSYKEIANLYSGIKTATIIDLFSAKDIKPFIMQPFISAIKFIKKI